MKGCKGLVTARTGTTLTRESLEKFLNCLDEDWERAGEKYLTVRLSLIRFFEWRGCVFSEDHADETIDRVARRINQGEEIRNLRGYIVGVARFLLKEIIKQQEKHRTSLRHFSTATLTRSPVEDTRLECIQCCLQYLSPENRQLIMGYYPENEHDRIKERSRLAQQLGVSRHTLRMKVQRLRTKLEECISNCMCQGLDRRN